MPGTERESCPTREVTRSQPDVKTETQEKGTKPSRIAVSQSSTDSTLLSDPKTSHAIGVKRKRGVVWTSAKKKKVIEGDLFIDMALAKEIELRDYQLKILSDAMENNVIVYLPTGSGKTMIAIHLIRNKSYEIRRPIEEGGKRTFFLVCSKALVQQQAESISTLDLDVGQYTGDMNVDFWNFNIWQEEFQKNQVLVMTADIFKNILEKSFIRLTDVNLIVFDECHHGVKDSAYSQIMRFFQDVPRRDLPSVIGLSATLLNGNVSSPKVPDYLYSLEKTFNCKIATADNIAQVLQYSADPIIERHSYKTDPDSAFRNHINAIIHSLSKKIEVIDFPSDGVSVAGVHGVLQLKKKTKSKICRSLTDLIRLFYDFGLIGGTLAVLYYYIQFEQLRLFCEDEFEISIYNYILTECLNLRFKIEEEIAQLTLSDILSHKMKILVATLKHYNTLLKTAGKDFRCLLFVTQRTTAVIMYHVLLKLKVCDPELEFISHDFIIGSQANPLQNTREGIMDKRKHEAILENFRGGNINLIIATNAIDEGIDIRDCNVVIRYDECVDYRSFVQSKGRARQSGSYFAMLTPNIDELNKSVHNYQSTESKLKSTLITRTDEREVQPLKSHYTEIPTFYTNGPGSPCVTENSAIPLLFHYCQTLPHDLFCTLAPLWWFKFEGKNIVCTVELPTSSKLKEPLRSAAVANKKLAKRAAAMELCKKLYELNELDESLVPVKRNVDTLKTEDKELLFPHWKKEEVLKSGEIPGTKKRKQTYPIKFSESMTCCRPYPHQYLYLHVLKFTPVEEPPDGNNRRQVFHQLTASDETFAILSSKKIPNIYSFPVYLTSGEVTCELMVNLKTLTLTPEQINSLENFHFHLFYEVLPIAENLNFLTFDRENKENSYLLVPVKKFGLVYDINWEAVKLSQSTEKPAPTDLSVITPTHRPTIQTYIVTKVCDDMSPLTQFPSPNHRNYAEYYLHKYQKQLKTVNQPLLEVKQLSRRINYLRPRKEKPGGIRSQRKINEEREESEEHLIPELCSAYSFPAVLWLKATFLPSALYRIQTALCVDDFRRKIISDTGLGEENRDNWDPLSLDEHRDLSPEDEHPASTFFPTKIQEFNLSPWSDEKEPVDIDRRLEDISLCDLKYYLEFKNKSLELADDETLAPAFDAQSISDVDLTLLQVTSARGPGLRDLLEALTARSANDIINLERLETLGDSFLKFSVSLFLFYKYHSEHEGLLTDVKGRIIGNRNLLYCGEHRKIPSLVNVHDINPYQDWVPPSMVVPRRIQEQIRMQGVNPYVLLKMKSTKQEQFHGSNSSWERVVSQGDKCDNESPMESFISVKTMPDKTVSDCVEAIIGVYVKNCGLSAGFTILHWFNILPRTEGLMDQSPISPFIVNDDCQNLLNFQLRCIDYVQLEKKLGYTFHNRGYLLQAITHPSYTANRLTNCYQRLEFLGDAVLDFLITTYIFENCQNFSPGQITDLRSALVNNITFACLTVRFGFQKFLLHNTNSLLNSIANFVAMQERKGHIVDDASYLLVEEPTYSIAEGIDIPKALGDMFESLAGAIFLDSGNSLTTVWKVFYRLMKTEIKCFTKNIPKQPVRMLYENKRIDPKFTYEIVNSGIIRACCEVKINGEPKQFYGFGKNRVLAKQYSAKLALRHLMKTKS